MLQQFFPFFLCSNAICLMQFFFHFRHERYSTHLSIFPMTRKCVKLNFQVILFEILSFFFVESSEQKKSIDLKFKPWIFFLCPQCFHFYHFAQRISNKAIKWFKLLIISTISRIDFIIDLICAGICISYMCSGKYLQADKNRQKSASNWCTMLTFIAIRTLATSCIIYNNILKSSRPHIGTFTAKTSFVFVFVADVTFWIGVISQNQIPPSTKWFVFICTVSYSILLLFDYRIMSFHKTNTAIVSGHYSFYKTV